MTTTGTRREGEGRNTALQPNYGNNQVFLHLSVPVIIVIVMQMKSLVACHATGHDQNLMQDDPINRISDRLVNLQVAFKVVIKHSGHIPSTRNMNKCHS